MPGSVWGGDRRALAALLYEGYAAKAAALGVDKQTALTILAEALRVDRCLVAVSDGSAVGVVGLVEGRARALEFSLALVRMHFGASRTMRGSPNSLGGGQAFNRMTVLERTSLTMPVVVPMASRSRIAGRVGIIT